MVALTAAQTRQIAAEAETGYPEEICGFLIGRLSSHLREVTRLIPIANAWDAASGDFKAAGEDFATESARRRFAIPPDEYYRADQAARAGGEAILGFYHSHPDSPAVPSEYDLRLAQAIFPGYSYIIVSVTDGQTGGMTCWQLTDDSLAFQREPIRMSDDWNTFHKGVDRILYEIWDPIGINDAPGARDEYASYVPALVALLQGGASDAEIFGYLSRTERETMGLPGSSKEHRNAVIAHLRRFAEGE